MSRFIFYVSNLAFLHSKGAYNILELASRVEVEILISLAGRSLFRENIFVSGEDSMNSVEMTKLHREESCGADCEVSYIVCPVCGGRISAEQLPDKESVIDDGMFYMIETDRIINSRITIEHTFDHFFNEEEDCIRNDPHTLGSIIEAEFDGTGECIAFSVLKIYAVSGAQE